MNIFSSKSQLPLVGHYKGASLIKGLVKGVEKGEEIGEEEEESQYLHDYNHPRSLSMQYNAPANDLINFTDELDPQLR
jgi:hypothetical protein